MSCHVEEDRSRFGCRHDSTCHCFGHGSHFRGNQILLEIKTVGIRSVGIVVKCMCRLRVSRLLLEQGGMLTGPRLHVYMLERTVKGRDETVYYLGKGWLSLKYCCLTDGMNDACRNCWAEDGCSGCRMGSCCVGNFLEEDNVVCCTDGNSDCCNSRCGCNLNCCYSQSCNQSCV